jgi:hypothetical protein
VEADEPGLGRALAWILVTGQGGQRLVTCISPPLTLNFGPDPALNGLKERAIGIPVYPVNELLIRRDLPQATDDVMRWLGELGWSGPGLGTRTSATADAPCLRVTSRAIMSPTPWRAFMMNA